MVWPPIYVSVQHELFPRLSFRCMSQGPPRVSCAWSIYQRHSVVCISIWKLNRTQFDLFSILLQWVMQFTALKANVDHAHDDDSCSWNM